MKSGCPGEAREPFLEASIRRLLAESKTCSLQLLKGGSLYKFWHSLYAFDVATMNVSAARADLPGAVELARTEVVFLERYGRRAAVLLSPERYEQLMEAFEDAEDAVAFDAAMAEEGPNIPWDQVKADLGWA